MKTIKTNLNRRRFIYNVAGLLAVSAVIPSNIFANVANMNLKISTLGLGSEKIKSITKAMVTNSNRLTFASQSQKSDILFVGDFLISEIKNQIKSDSIILIEKFQNPVLFEELVAFCNSRNIYLAEIAKWTDDNNTENLFDKVIFHETKFNHQSVEQSINYLNILSKITANTGLIIA